MPLHQRQPQNNGLVLLPKAVLVYWNYLLFYIAADGKDGNRLKILKKMANFSSSESVSWKNQQKLIMVCFPN